jgi:hypothetical protein
LITRVLTVSLAILGFLVASVISSPALPGSSASPDSPFVQVDAAGGKKKASPGKCSQKKGARKKGARKRSRKGKAAPRAGSSSAHIIDVERQDNQGLTT